ncbi:branched-chain amino acid aminotransferase, partial [Bacillus sp. B-TM1]
VTAITSAAVPTVDGRTIGLGQTGPHTNRLLEEFRKLVIEDGEKIYEENKVFHQFLK